MNKYYTRQGDDGTSSTRGNKRIDKSNLLFELLGTLDEASACLSLAMLQINEKELRDLIGVISNDLQLLMAEAAGDKKSQIKAGRIEWLEKEIDRLGEGILMPEGFITAWTKSSSATLNLARTVVRRAERVVVAHTRSQGKNNPNWIIYLDRLSSLLYVLQLVMENPILKG